MKKEFAIANMFANIHSALEVKALEASNLLAAALLNKPIQFLSEEGWVDVTPDFAIENLNNLQDVSKFRVKE